MLKVTQSSRVAAQLYKGVINWHWITDFPNFLFIFILDLTQSTLLSNPSFPIFESLTFLSIKRFKPRDHVRIHASGLEIACNWGQKRDIITHKSLDIKFFPAIYRPQETIKCALDFSNLTNLGPSWTNQWYKRLLTQISNFWQAACSTQLSHAWKNMGSWKNILVMIGRISLDPTKVPHYVNSL